MMDLLFGGMGKWLAAAAALVLAFLGVYTKGRKDRRRETALEAAEREAKTRKRMDDAEASMGDDPAVLRDSLRERGKRTGGL